MVGEGDEQYHPYDLDPSTLERADPDDPNGTHIHPKQCTRRPEAPKNRAQRDAPVSVRRQHGGLRFLRVVQVAVQQGRNAVAALVAESGVA